MGGREGKGKQREGEGGRVKGREGEGGRGKGREGEGKREGREGEGPPHCFLDKSNPGYVLPNFVQLGPPPLTSRSQKSALLKQTEELLNHQ